MTVLKYAKNFMAMVLIFILCDCEVMGQYTVPKRTYSGCTTHVTTYSSWDSAWTYATTDTNYGGDSSWTDPTNISSSGSSTYAYLNNAKCTDASSTCLAPILYGSISSPAIPSTATISNMEFSFNRRNYIGSSLTFADYDTYEIFVCVGAEETSYASCDTTLRVETAGLRTTWTTSFVTESYSFTPTAYMTTAEINAGINFGTQVQITEGSGSTSFEIQALENDWVVNITYQTCT
jgi:hypothetical protein